MKLGDEYAVFIILLAYIFEQAGSIFFYIF